MKIIVNGDPVDVNGPSLCDVLIELNYAGRMVATAVNRTFVPKAARGGHLVQPGDRIEIVAPQQGG